MPSPDDSALSAEVRARIARYELRAARMEATLANYRRRRPIYHRAFVALLVFGFACFGINHFLGLWATISAIVISGGGSVMLKGRLWEVGADIAATREEIAHLRSGRATAAPRAR